ncbi:hypothetical protein JCM9803A_40150 [Rhodococcus erythropolis]
MTAPDPGLTDLVAALDEIIARETQLTSEINRLANVYGYESVSVHDRINYRVAAFPSMLDLAQKVVTHALQTEATIARVTALTNLDGRPRFGAIPVPVVLAALEGGGDGCVAERG